MNEEDLAQRRAELEATLGLGRIDWERRIPGLVARVGDEVRYVSCEAKDTDKELAESFRQIIRQVDPPLLLHGCALSENCTLTLPSGECFFGLSYNGDLEGWRNQIQQGAKLLERKIAEIVDDKLQISDGREVNLADCLVHFY